MRNSWKLWTLFMGLGSLGVAGCAAKQDPDAWKSAGVGTMQLALTASGPTGAQYHLANAVFEVTNFAVFPPLDRTFSGDAPTLEIDLPPSVFPFDYQIVLQDGWTLNAVNPDGTETPLSATLLSNFVSFTIKPQRTTPVSFRFKASEQVITTGNGTASVKVVVDDTLIDDFEDGDGLIAPLGGRRGAWFTFNDGSGAQTPAPGTPVVPEVVDESATFLLHTTGTGFAPQGLLPDGTFAFGAGVGTDLLFDPTTAQPIPYDASKYAGINFTFSTKSAASAPLLVSFLVGTSATTPVDQGGTCVAGCSDDFGIVGPVPPGDFTFTGGFSWSQLTQQGFGTPTTFDPATILTIKWIVAFQNIGQSASDDAFDFRLDDISFVAGVVTTGGSGTGGTTGGGAGGSTGSGGSGGIGDACMTPNANTGTLCSGTAACNATCGIDAFGARPCACNGMIDICGPCFPPTGANFPIALAAVACSDVGAPTNLDSEIRNMPCDAFPLGTTCVAANTTTTGGPRGCVCWDVTGVGMPIWHCGSTNDWFRGPVSGRPDAGRP